jgi:hypothetical protein
MYLVRTGVKHQVPWIAASAQEQHNYAFITNNKAPANMYSQLQTFHAARAAAHAASVAA